MVRANELPVNPADDMLFSDGSIGNPKQLLNEQFEVDAGWQLRTADIYPDPESNDRALAKISDGKLTLKAEQDFGGPTASASRVLSLRNPINGLTLKLNIDSYNYASFTEATAKVLILSNDHLVTYQLGCAATLYSQSKGYADAMLANFTLILKVRGTEVTSKLNDLKIDSVSPEDCYTVQELVRPASNSVGLGFYLEAKDYDGAYYSVDIVVDSLEVHSF